MKDPAPHTPVNGEGPLDAVPQGMNQSWLQSWR